MEKRYNAAAGERQMQEFWKREEIYRFDPNTGGELYSIDTPPPTVSGSLHIGHLFSYTQAEMIARFHRMQGRNVFYPFGFDDNGLPTERLVERDEHVRATSLPRGEFIDMCRSITKKYEDEFRQFWDSLGFSVDWSLTYRTVSEDVQKISQAHFLDLARRGKAYAKESPVLWCTECRTSIAQAELDTADAESDFIYIPFQAGEEELQVATTRPELLYGCVCLFVHPDDMQCRGHIGKRVKVPLYGHEIPVLADDKVGVDKGTGIVMCATFGDAADAQWYTEHQLPYRRVILPEGRIDGAVPYIGGLGIRAARREIIRLLEEHGLLLKAEHITHTLGTHERCGTPIEIIPSRQWYIDILSGKEQFLKAGDEISWYPANMKNRYIAWVENLKWDWCISRQRYFGVPFPVWYCEACGKPAFAREEQLPVNPLEEAYEGMCECGCRKYIPESAVLDTWATSSLTPQINERLGMELLPMSMRTHAHEIIRTWTFYTIVRSLYHTGKLPWKDLMICGFVLAKKGEKISKSKGNDALDPKRLIQAHSADVLRYWTAGARLGTDTFFSADELGIPQRFITKLWNASKFAISHLADFEPDGPVELLPIDRWMMERVKQTAMNASKLMAEYEIGAARHEIDELFWRDFCDHYIELVKARLYEPDIHGIECRHSGQHALYYALLNILKLYAVYVPHITEYIYQAFFRRFEGTLSIHLTRWVKAEEIDDALIRFGTIVEGAMADMRKYKAERNLSVRAPMEALDINMEQRFEGWMHLTHGDIRACTGAGRINYIIE